ncbi:MAG: tetraacyldisaccharide 4'-kinase [Acidobacteriota bacterium]
MLNVASIIYKTVSFINLKLKGLRIKKFDNIKIISVNNLSFGGTGKTPMVLEIASVLEEAGFKFSIVTRGYGSKSERSGTLVNSNHSWREVGDEVKMISNEFPGTDIFTGGNRKKSIAKSIKRGNKIVILDDGFQSTGIRKDLSIMMINPGQEYYYLRNFKFMAGKEDIILYYRGEKPVTSNYHIRKKGDHGEYSFEFSSFQTADGLPADPGNLPVFGFSALGDNDRFKSDLGNLNLKGFKEFKDHHKYSPNELKSLLEDMKKAKADFLVCTYKDFVKITDTIKDGFPLIYIKNRVKCNFDLKGYILSIVK